MRSCTLRCKFAPTNILLIEVNKHERAGLEAVFQTVCRLIHLSGQSLQRNKDQEMTYKCKCGLNISLFSAYNLL